MMGGNPLIAQGCASRVQSLGDFFVVTRRLGNLVCVFGRLFGLLILFGESSTQKAVRLEHQDITRNRGGGVVATFLVVDHPQTRCYKIEVIASLLKLVVLRTGSVVALPNVLEYCGICIGFDLCDSRTAKLFGRLELLFDQLAGLIDCSGL